MFVFVSDTILAKFGRNFHTVGFRDSDLKCVVGSDKGGYVKRYFTFTLKNYYTVTIMLIVELVLPLPQSSPNQNH